MKRKLIYLFIAFAAAILPAHAQKFLNDELTLSNVSLWHCLLYTSDAADD